MRKALCLLMLAVIPLLAVAADEDAPGRVARLSLLQGEVSLAPAGTDEFADAALNRPLTSGDRVWVDKDARAELQAGAASVHLDQNSGFSFEDLDDRVMRMSLTDGSATIRVRRKLDSETIVVETPNATVALLHPGEYHIEVNEAGDQTIVKARSGEAAITGEKDSYVVRAAETGVFKGATDLTADITAVGSRTAFESWANDRDRREENSKSAQYVSRDVVGYEDLDEDGDWISEPEYGYVWAPRHVYAGWAPYRDGRWAWVSPWGWTWVDNARWGFAPFHYGRWAYVSHRSRWCWVPGPRNVRPIYAPALVGWVGSPGINVSVGFGSGVGWFPLGPREVYVPGYWHSRRYIHNVNVSNTIIVNNVYINDAYRGRRERIDYRYRSRADAVTVVSRDSFTGGRSIRDHQAPVRDLQNWRQQSRPPAIAPVRDSVFAGNRVRPSTDLNARFARADRSQQSSEGYRDRGATESRQRYAGRVPFDTERRAIEANGGRPVARSQLFTSTPRDRTSVRQGGSFGRAVATSSATKDAQSQRNVRESVSRSSLATRDHSLTGSGAPPQWRNGEYRNRDAGNGRATSIPRSSAIQTPAATPENGSQNRGDRRSGRAEFTPGVRSQEPDVALGQRDVARERAVIAEPAFAEQAPQRNSWRTTPAERAPRTESAPTFEPRVQRESRSSPRTGSQREARQVERVQAAPARESVQPQQSAPQRATRGDQGSSRSGNESRVNERRGSREMQK